MARLNTLRHALAAGACALLMATAAQAQTRNFNVPAGDLKAGLDAYADQSGVQLIYRSDDLRGVRTPGVHGARDAADALQDILAGTGFIVQRQPSGAIAIVRTGRPQPEAAAPAEPPAAVSEVVVTAQKRSERIQDVPVPVTAIDAQSLVSSNQLRLQDYFSSVPGLNLEVEGSRGAPILSIRGITTGDFTNPTVGVTVDDVPFGSSTFVGGGYITPDLDPSDLQRIEVLRGPQGTLYGVASLGGLLKYVTIDPSTSGVFGKLEAGVDGVSHGHGAGYDARGSLNAPVSDVLAVYVSGFVRHDPGYVENVLTGEKGVNSGDTEGGRLSALWRPSEQFSVKLSALLQHAETDGSPASYRLPGLGDLQQTTLPGSGGYHKNIQAYSGTINADLGPVKLTSITGYSFNDGSFSIDYTSALGGLAHSVFGVDGVNFQNPLKTAKFSQETRLSGSFGDRVEWLAGGFYTHERSRYASVVTAADLSSGAPAGVLVHYDNPTTYEELAAFADLTFRITDRFDIQVGGRESRNRETSSSTLNSVFGNSVTPLSRSDDNAFTYLFTPRLKLTPDVMVYARLASGYRAGGPNPNNVFLGAPASYGPDTTENYELGLKGDFLDHRLSVDASLYDIEWKDIQLTLESVLSPGSNYVANGGKARSRGVELSLEARPVDGLKIGAWGAWNDAKLTTDLPAASTAIGHAGDRLPFSSRFSANVSADEDFAVSSEVDGFVGASLSYVGSRLGGFLATPGRQSYPAYTRIDLRAGVRTGPWTATVYVNNLADRRGILIGGLDAFPMYAFNYIQPRTAGVSLSRSF